jgi:hypothetical protein
MVAPKARPTHGSASADYRAGKITDRGRTTPGRSSAAAGRTIGNAGHRGGANFDVARSPATPWSAKQAHKPIARFDAADARTRLSWSAATVDLAGRDSGDANSWPLCTPDGPVTVPDCQRRTSKGGAGRDHSRGGGQNKPHADYPFPEPGYLTLR